jgi:hypothetical protein
MSYTNGIVLYYINYEATGACYEIIKHITDGEEVFYLVKDCYSDECFLVPNNMINGNDQYNSRFFTSKKEASKMHNKFFKKSG